MSLWNSFKKKISETYSGLDFWDKEENQQQRQAFAQPQAQAPQPQVQQQAPSNQRGIWDRGAQQQAPSFFTKPEEPVIPKNRYSEWDNITSFANTAADKIGGGTGRSILRTAGLAADNPVTRAILPAPVERLTQPVRQAYRRTTEQVADEWDRNAQASRQQQANQEAANAGARVGSIVKGVADVATIAAPTSKADKLAGASRIVKGLSSGNKAQKALGYVTKIAPGSLVASGVDAIQEVGRGNTVNPVRSVGVGLATDIAAPIVLKPVVRLAGHIANNVRIRMPDAVPIKPSTTTPGITPVPSSVADDVPLSELGGARPGNDIQLQIEQALNSGDRVKAQQIVDTMDEGSLKAGMQSTLDALNGASTTKAVFDPVTGKITRVPIAQAAVTPPAQTVKVDKTIPELMPDLKESQKIMDDPKYAPVKIRNGIKSQASQAFIDRDAPLIKMLGDMEKQSGESGLVDQFMYDTGLQRRANSIANARLQESENLKGAFKGLTGKDLKSFNDYVAARAELSNAQRGLGTTAPVEDIQARVDAGDLIHGERFTSLNKFYKDLADDAYSAGLIDREKHDLFVSDPDYTRIQRDLGDLVNVKGNSGNSYSLGSTVTSQKRKGSSKAIQAADMTAFDYVQRLQKEIQRNQTATNLIDTLEKFEMARPLSASEAVNKNTIKRIVNGKTEIYEIDPEIKKIVDNVSSYQLNTLEKIIGAPARILRAGTTGLSAPFTIANYFKDQLGSGINSKRMAATHSPQNILSGLYQASKDQLTGGNNDKLWRKFIAHAGDTTSYDITRNVKEGKEISRAVRIGKPAQAGNAIMHPIRTLEDLNSITEKATRFQNFKGVYEKAVKKGATEQEALQQATLAAWQNSVDFNRAGDWGRAVNLLIPYFNASIQGTRQMGRSFKARPIGTSAKMISTVTLPLAAVTMYNLSDPDTAAIYDNISEFEKENNFIFIPPGTKQNKDGTYDVFKLPMPPGFSNLAGPTRRAIESYARKEPADIPAMAQDVLGALSGPINTHTGRQFLSSITPQGVKPTVQQMANKDLFTGKPIVEDFINTDLDANGNPIKESEKTYKSTSGSAQQIGKMLNVSPIRVEKFIKDTFGKTGQYTENAVDNLLAEAKAIPSDQVGGVSVREDVIRRFSKAQGTYNNMKSDSAKFFDDQKAGTTGLSKVDQAAWETIHPKKKNTKGEIVDETSILDSAEKTGIYLNHPKVFEADKKIDQLQRERGKVGNPLFDLSDDQRQKVLVYRSSKMLNAGKQTYDRDKNPLFVSLGLDEPWYDGFRTAETKFYDSVKKPDTAKDNDPKTFSGAPKPVASPELQQKIDKYYQLPAGTGDRSMFLRANPDILDYWENSDGFTNKERAAIGLKSLEEKEDSYSGGSGNGRKKAAYGTAGFSAPIKFGNYGSSRSLTTPSVNIKVSKVKVAKRYAPKKVKIVRNKQKNKRA